MVNLSGFLAVAMIKGSSNANAGPVAQRLEQGTHNPLVLGSNPSGPIRKSCGCRGCLWHSDQRQESCAWMFHLQKIAALTGWLVHAESSHDAKCRRAFERSDKSGGAVEKMGAGRPSRHLIGIQEKAAGMWVQRTLKNNRVIERLRDQRFHFAYILPRSGYGGIQWAVDVCLVNDAVPRNS